MNVGRALSRVSRDDLMRVLDAVRSGRLRAPIRVDGLAALGFAHLYEDVGLLLGLERGAAEAVLQAVIAERDAQSAPKLHLVWSGPEAIASEAQDTRAVVQRMFENARSHVLIGGYAFDHGDQILAPLHASMRDHGVAVEMFLHVDPPEHGTGDLRAHCMLSIDRFLAANWPFGEPRPTIYFDPRTAGKSPYLSLHAKCVVTDERCTLVTSANFTARAQQRNIEAGVLIDDEAFAKRFLAHWRALVSQAFVERYA